MPKVSEEHRQERRRQITDGARHAFAEHGYAGATVEVLERAIGLSRGAIFSYFPTKLDLFVALAEEDQRRLLELWLEGGHEAVIRHVVHDNPEWLGVYLDVARMLRTDPELRDRWRSLNPEGQAKLDRRYTELVEAGLIRADVPLETIGRFLGVLFDGLAVQQAAQFGEPIDADGTIELLRSALAPK